MYEQLRGAFEKLSNREDAAMMRSYMRDKFAFYGIKNRSQKGCLQSPFKRSSKK